MQLSKLKASCFAVLVVPVLVTGCFQESLAQQAKRLSHPPVRMEQQLGLSAEQAREIKAIQEESRAKSQTLHRQARQKRQELMKYLKSPEASESAALRMQDELNELQGRLGELRIKTWFDMRERLTPEQLQKMEQLRGPMGPKRSPARGRAD